MFSPCWKRHVGAGNEGFSLKYFGDKTIFPFVTTIAKNLHSESTATNRNFHLDTTRQMPWWPKYFTLSYLLNEGFKLRCHDDKNHLYIFATNLYLNVPTRKKFYLDTSKRKSSHLGTCICTIATEEISPSSRGNFFRKALPRRNFLLRYLRRK